MAGWIQNLLGGKREAINVRALLAEAIAEIGAPSLVEQGLGFFDDPDSMLEWDGLSGEPAWSGGARPPSAGERASTILFELLQDDRRLAIVDWAAGTDDILDAFDAMFAKHGAATVAGERRAAFEALTANAARGQPAVLLREPLEQEAETRGLALHWWLSEQDAYFPLILPRAAYARWLNQSFGDGYAVLP